jgi:peptide/nickel transport system substrate-binding protein
VTFTDGLSLIPEDVIASFHYHMNSMSESQLRTFFSSVETVTVTGENNVTVKPKSPDVQFQYTPAHMAGFIFSKSQPQDFPEDIGLPEHLPLGTGPYKLVQFSPEDPT